MRSKGAKLHGKSGMIIFGAVALLAALGDIRIMLARGVQAARRSARHLWAMCFALFLAAASFFLGQAQLFAEPLRNGALLAMPVLLVLLLMFYWLARVLLTGGQRRACNSFNPETLRGSA
jgi:amino acid permease